MTVGEMQAFPAALFRYSFLLAVSYRSNVKPGAGCAASRSWKNIRRRRRSGSRSAQ